MNSLPPKPSSSIGNRKERRRRERHDEKYTEIEAGPSRPPSHERDRDQDRDPRKKRRSKRKEKEKPNGIINELSSAEASKQHRTNGTFEIGEDFVPFVASSEDEEQAPVREWDRNKGKSRASDRDHERDKEGSGKKRKYDLIFDEDDMVQQRRGTFRKAPWVTAVDWESCKNVSDMCVLRYFAISVIILCSHRLHREVEAFINYISPTPVEDEVRSLVVDLVSAAVTQAFPDAKVEAFGSFGTKLYLPLGYVPSILNSVPLLIRSNFIAT
jgi:non-canonical poly(A) RNA polymerase PAPD5/7